ncbi:MAG: YlbF family regulator [Candidatus Methylacidiphilales bacterium]
MTARPGGVEVKSVFNFLAFMEAALAIRWSIMIQPTLDHSAIIEKTRELCQLILSQPALVSCRKDIHAFLDDESAQSQYRHIADRGRALEEMQLSGRQPEAQEVEDFEKSRYDFLENPVAKNFIEAQQMMNEIQETVNTYVNKSFELGRVPTEEEIAEAEEDCGGCGSGCGCH